ncbi:MAG: AtpZ/AtpI family protein [Erysipelotrichaceae bacterium]|jgi:F0F1-type ATP synthase assembly protein I|nr:AtpZ/AtpI family protein [Bacillota bacterium]NLP22372.1 hypothetical protein [Erysipelotrichaceae bacterium]HCY06130.1 hypothetical protein [Erysipelotrichaceae bacterium]
MNKPVLKFIGRLIVGLFVGVVVGNILDKKFNTTPFIMIGLIVYVVFGSLYILVKGEK